MTYGLEVRAGLDTKFQKLRKKDPKQFGILAKLINKICQNPEHFKPLRGDMAGARRVHVGKSFVLVFDIDYQNNTVKLLDYNHHDKIY
jgi:mRNA interferase RelE/StbE/toxin YoeB